MFPPMMLSTRLSNLAAQKTQSSLSLRTLFTHFMDGIPVETQVGYKGHDFEVFRSYKGIFNFRRCLQVPVPTLALTSDTVAVEWLYHA